MTETLMSGLSALLCSLPKVTNGSEQAKVSRTALKMYCFLLTSILNEMEKTVTTSNTIAIKSRNKKKKEDKKSKNEWDWEATKEVLVGALVEVLECPHVYPLWPLASPESEFGTCCLFFFAFFLAISLFISSFLSVM